MSLMRSLLLAAFQNRWLRDHATHYRFVRSTVSRFMPGETFDDAMQAAQNLRGKQIGTVFTHLGENIKDPTEAQQIAYHYLEVLSRIQQSGLRAEISIKLTQLGLDLSPDLCFSHLKNIIERAPKDSVVWLDMEASNYVDATLELHLRALELSQTSAFACKHISFAPGVILRSCCPCAPRFGSSKVRTTNLPRLLSRANKTSTTIILLWPKRC